MEEAQLPDDVPNLRPPPASAWCHLGYVALGAVLALGSLVAVVLSGGAGRAHPELYLVTLAGLGLVLYGLGGGILRLAATLVRRRSGG